MFLKLMRSRVDFGGFVGGCGRALSNCFSTLLFFFCIEVGKQKSSKAKETPCSHSFVSRQNDRDK